MGMYTHLVLNVTLRSDTPQEVIDTINYMVGNTEVEPPKQVHELFETERWDFCLRCDSAYFMGETHSSFTNHYDNWELTVNSNVKNYCHEYSKFLDYIQPYIRFHEFLGFVRYEEDDNPTLIYNTKDGIECFTPDVKLKGELW